MTVLKRQVTKTLKVVFVTCVLLPIFFHQSLVLFSRKIIWNIHVVRTHIEDIFKPLIKITNGLIDWSLVKKRKIDVGERCRGGFPVRQWRLPKQCKHPYIPWQPASRRGRIKFGGYLCHCQAWGKCVLWCPYARAVLACASEQDAVSYTRCAATFHFCLPKLRH